MANKRYWGDAEVVKLEIRTEVTPLGMPIYRVELSNGRTLNLSKKLFEAGASDKPTDLNGLYDNYSVKFVKEMETFLDEWGISEDDYQKLMMWVDRVVDVKKKAAQSKGMGLRDESEWSLVNYHLINGVESDTTTE